MDTLDRAVVIGGSIAGLAAAAALSPRAAGVVVVERRQAPPGGSVAAQGHLPHVLLAAGGRVLETLFPGFAQGLLDRGAERGGDDPTRLPCYWTAAGTVRHELRLDDLGFPRALCSRALVEARLRAATLALPNVTLVEAGAEGLVLARSARGGDVVAGVRLRGGAGTIDADLVVDAGGRSSRVTEWLASAGVPRPRTTEVVVDLRYTAFCVERRPTDLGGAAFGVIQNTRDVPRIGVALPVEGDRWQVVLGGYFGAAAPTDTAGAQAFARGLSDPALAELLGRPGLAEPARYTFRSSLRRHWDGLPRLPRGLCAVGDAVASFNPIYGQGMTSALLQVEALAAAVDRHGAGPRLGAAHARAAAKVVDNPWLTATGGDFAYPATTGRRPPGTTQVNRYVERVTRAAAVDDVVNGAFTRVQQLLAPPPTLFRPVVVARALRYGGPARGVRPEPAGQPVAP
jgi:2-polyprenyl-6-methoxyphenol hydroxylase-like FAD-dependent oxidoreductase